MSTKTAVRIVRDSKHTGTVTRQQVDRAIRLVEAGQFVRKNGSIGMDSSPKRDSDTRVKH